MRKLLNMFSVAVLLAIGCAQGTWAQKAKVYDLGHYPGGTWAEMHGINDSGVAVGVGDVAGDTRLIGVPLFGHNANDWFESGVSSGAVDEVLPAISNTGIMAGSINGDNGKPEAFAWMPNDAGYHLGTLPGDFASYAYAINHTGTLIVGQTVGEVEGTFRVTAVVWTPRVNWTDGRPTLTWEIHALPTGGLEQPGAVFEGVALRYWGGWGVNDLGQIAGDAYYYDPDLDEWWEIAVVWNPAKHGKGWELERLAMADGFAYTEALGINNLGEIVGDVWESSAFPALWKKDLKKNSWSVKVLPVASGLTYGWSVAMGINELGDIVGPSTDENWNNMATRWNSHDIRFVKLLGFPGDSSIAFGVNNLGIAVGGYVSGTDPEQAVAVKFR